MTVITNDHASVQTSLRPGPTPETWTVTFESPSVPGALAAFAGTLTAVGFDIVSATVLPRLDGTVTDYFDVIPLGGTSIAENTAHHLAECATAALRGTVDLASVLVSMREQTRPLGDAPTPSVELLLDSELTTGIKIVCGDRPGLLYDLTSTLTRHRMRCRAISVLTFHGRAVDTFRIIDAEGLPPTGPTVLSVLKKDLLAACGA